MRKLLLLSLLVISTASLSFAQKKPIVWIISDGIDNTLKQPDGRNISDPDDVSALAAYLLMSNHFDTRGIVLSSNNHKYLLKGAENQAVWADRYFGEAYRKDLPNLNKYIGGYQPNIPFLESALRETGVKFNPYQKYTSLDEYPSIKALYDLVESSEERVNVLCWGILTESAIFVNYCKSTGREDLLEKVRFISHWTNSSYHVGTMEHPEKVHNCFNDSNSCDYMKTQALNGNIKFYECGAIGQYGVVEGSQRGEEYYKQFQSSYLGEIFIEGKYVDYKGYVDGSDAATFWVLLGNWGVSLNDISSNGLNFPDVEAHNEKAFFDKAKDMNNELLRRSRSAAGAVANPTVNYNLFPGHGLTDPHVWVENGRLYLFGGHDESWETNDTWRMNRWEIWSTANLREWKHEQNILPTSTYIGDKPNCWAGDIVERDGKYYWYFSNRNTNTGVVVANSITGEYTDPLGKPLLEEGIIGKLHPYDPEIFVENGKYYIIFGAGTYHIAELAKDMISLKTKPKPIEIKDKDGNTIGTQDKSSAFKRGDIYYLVWGYQYATAKSIDGPYTYQGKFLSGGHTSIFEWNDQWYVVQENKDVSLFYRGIALKPIYFDRDGTILLSHDDIDYPGVGRNWTFEVSQMGWRSVSGTELEHNTKNKTISGTVSGNVALESATWLLNSMEPLKKVKVSLKNGTSATKLKVAIATYTPVKGTAFWSDPEIDWNSQPSTTIEIKSNSKEFIEYEIAIPKENLADFLKTIRIEPTVGATSGKWEINRISIGEF
ncbi:MAG: family 43 glycosylhydrolase [Rikenellaceae bacterium]